MQRTVGSLSAQTWWSEAEISQLTSIPFCPSKRCPAWFCFIWNTCNRILSETTCVWRCILLTIAAESKFQLQDHEWRRPESEVHVQEEVAVNKPKHWPDLYDWEGCKIIINQSSHMLNSAGLVNWPAPPCKGRKRSETKRCGADKKQRQTSLSVANPPMSPPVSRVSSLQPQSYKSQAASLSGRPHVR